MNKLFIVLLAVCLVSVSAFVKRDAPETATEQNYLDKIKQDFQGLSEQVKTQLTKTFDPEVMKKSLDEFQTKFNEFASQITAAPAKSA